MNIEYDSIVVKKTINTFTSTGSDNTGNNDGMHIENNTLIEDSVIDMTDQPQTDEALSVVRNGNAVIKNTIIRGTNKLILIGSGDNNGKGVVEFENCIFENGCRRFPEVQDGYIVVCTKCTIRNWALKKFFETMPKQNRAFGAWVHGKGSKLIMIDCHFEQDSFFQLGGLWNMLKDLGNQIGTAVNDEGIRGLFRISTWIPGVCRGAYATDKGSLELYSCTKNHWWIRLENNEKR